MRTYKTIYLAYPVMLFATAMIWQKYDFLQNLIPGHFIISLLVLECGAVILTFLIMLLKLIGPAFSTLGCMFMLCFILEMVRLAVKPDSVQFFVLIAVIYSAITFTLCYITLTSKIVVDGLEVPRTEIPVLSWIVAGLLNAFSAALYIMEIRGVWEDYRFPQGDYVVEDKILTNSILGDICGGPCGFASVPGAVVFYIVFAVVCLGAFCVTFICRKDLP